MTTTDLQQQWQRLVEAGALRWAPSMRLLGRLGPVVIIEIVNGFVMLAWALGNKRNDGTYDREAMEHGDDWAPDFDDDATEGVIARQAREALADPSAFVGSICTDDGTLQGWVIYGRTDQWGVAMTDTIGSPAATRVGAWMSAVEHPPRKEADHG